MISEKIKISYLFFVIVLIFILSTNSYFDYNQSLIFGGADGISYYEISKNSPFISNTPLKPIHTERFVFPYIIGIISNVFSLDIFYLYRLLDVILIKIRIKLLQQRIIVIYI